MDLMTTVLTTVEDFLPAEMKSVKRAALSGDVNAQYEIGSFYYKEGLRGESDKLMACGINFLARAARQGHSAARAKFIEDGEDWNNY
jgi:TPR repeat protein